MERAYILRTGGKSFGLCRPIVTMAQPAQSLLGKHPTRSFAARSAPRCSLLKSKVRAVLMMVGTYSEQSLQVPLVQSNHVVQQVASAAPHPALRDAILPRTFGMRFAWQLFSWLSPRPSPPSRILIPVKDQISASRLKWKCLPQLLDDPSARRMLRDVEVQDTPTIVADDKEAVEDAEGDRGHGEEVHGRNRFPLDSKEGAPALAWSGLFGARFIQREMVLSERSKPSRRSSP